MTVCPEPDCRCRCGFVALDLTDIDPWTEEPRRTPHDACGGTGFIPRQLELFNDQA